MFCCSRHGRGGWGAQACRLTPTSHSHSKLALPSFRSPCSSGWSTTCSRTAGITWGSCKGGQGQATEWGVRRFTGMPRRSSGAAALRLRLARRTACPASPVLKLIGGRGVQDGMACSTHGRGDRHCAVAEAAAVGGGSGVGADRPGWYMTALRYLPATRDCLLPGGGPRFAGAPREPERLPLRSVPALVKSITGLLADASTAAKSARASG